MPNTKGSSTMHLTTPGRRSGAWTSRPDQNHLTASRIIHTRLGVIGGVLIAAYKFLKKPEELEKKIQKIRATHEEDIRKINEEQCLITYGLLACLKGLKEKGCNGPVTEAINKIEKHLNKQAHDMEE